jgi:hypothetical protein
VCLGKYKVEETHVGILFVVVYDSGYIGRWQQVVVIMCVSWKMVGMMGWLLLIAMLMQQM